jgi:hypothetical protein
MLYGLLLVVLFFLVINYFRKLHWDAVHNNLFDLVDKLGGNVYRRGFLARPVYHGKYKKHELTINFSQERINSKRKNYINISIDKKNKDSVTIVSMDWLKMQNERADNFKMIALDDEKKYGIQIQKLNHHLVQELKSKLSEMKPFNYAFFGQTGLIFEQESMNLGIETKLDQIKPVIDSVYELSKTVN